jgi:protoporphyrinogen oxidase
MVSNQEVAVVGGGITGLAASLFLARAGARVTLYEASDQLGGLGTFFEYRGRPLERFYHCMLPSDRHLLLLLQELGLERETYWKQTSFGFAGGGRIYPLNTAVDLLQFGMLPVQDRLRVGLTGLWGSICSPAGLDDVSCVEWLSRLSGRRAFDRFWRPMLQAKFGDRYHEVPALWFWTRFNREKGGSKETKGYIRGGYRRIIDTLRDAILAADGRIRLNASLDSLDLARDGRIGLQVGSEAIAADRMLFTAPLPLLRKVVAGGRLESVVGELDHSVDMQGVINGLFLLRRPLTTHYWLAATDADMPFQGIVETTTLLRADDAQDLNLVYVMNYLHRSDPRFAADDSAILAGYWTGLRRLFPDLQESDVVDRFVFRSPFVEPLYTLGYGGRRPPSIVVPDRLYLATTAQVYPEVTSWNGAVGMVRQVVGTMLS